MDLQRGGEIGFNGGYSYNNLFTATKMKRMMMMMESEKSKQSWSMKRILEFVQREVGAKVDATTAVLR